MIVKVNFIQSTILIFLFLKYFFVFLKKKFFLFLIFQSLEGEGLLVMAIDNLPTEMAAEASSYFGSALIDLVKKLVIIFFFHFFYFEKKKKKG